MGSHSKNSFNALTQKLFQLFIVITCHKLLNTTFRFLLNRLYKINEAIINNESLLYKSCDDVLSVIIEVLRVLPIPLRRCISSLFGGMDEYALLEWLLSTIFSPLLLQPDDWYLVICNPAIDETTNNNNIQSIVTTLLRLCRAYKISKKEELESKEKNVTDLLLEKHGSTLTKLLNQILMEKDCNLKGSEVLVPSNATPELFVWHKILIMMTKNDQYSNIMSEELRTLCLSTTPPKNI